MNTSLRSILSASLFGWIALAIVGFFYLFTFDGFKPVLRENRINFGLDLVGGTYITLEVQVDKAIEAELSDKLQVILKNLEEANRPVPVSQSVEDQQITLQFDSIQDANDALRLIKGQSPELNIFSDGQKVRLALTENEEEKIATWAVQGNIDVLRARLDDFGVGEIPISAQGEKNIIVELPNVKDPQKAKDRIGTTALLEVKLVEHAANSEEEIQEAYDWDIPEGFEIIPNTRRTEFYLVPKYTDLTGRLLKDAYVDIGGPQRNQVVVSFQFKKEGGDKFYKLTSENYGRRIAMIVDEEVVSAPRVSTAIGSSGYIYGEGFTTETAKELATLLKSGAFVAPVKFIEERQIGPSLGAESIRQGLLACLVGLGLLIVFSIAMYKTAGFFAFLALVFNLFLVLLILSFLRATLTLPGIAGMVLTVGMAIDASILIFEKIKEELAAGVTEKKAVNIGFSDAMQVILDSNITTFLVGIVLYKFGTGPIQGFAITMMVGIISTLITGLFFLRSIFSFALYNLGVQKIRI